MKIEIKVIDHSRQRYPTVGDWQYAPDGSKLRISISRQKDRRSEIALILHEVAEALLCEHAHVSPEAVDAWDMGPIGMDLAEPGADERAPYHKQHTVATLIEQMMCEALELPWEQHDANVNESEGS